MIKVLILRGLPASGKSTWAKQLMSTNPNAYKRINKDDLRAMLDDNHWSRNTEDFIKKVRDALILMAIEEGKHVIVDDTNFGKHENYIRELVKGKAEVVVQDFTHVTPEECIKRDLKRLNSVGETVIWRMYNQHLKPEIPVLEHVDGLPHAIICDLDGTLAHLNGRNPYDASTCDQDLLNHTVADIVKTYNQKGKHIILCSGRQDKYRPQTEKFLEIHEIPYSELWMRATGDFRKDSIIKTEIFETKIKGFYNIDFVIDDRLSVSKTWSNIGLYVFCCNQGLIDF